MRRTYIPLVAISLLFATGCGQVSLDFDLPSLRDLFSMSNGAEFVAASQKGEKTSNLYVVDTSTGSTFGNLVATTPNGYKIYSSVEGQITSETVQQQQAEQY